MTSRRGKSHFLFSLCSIASILFLGGGSGLCNTQIALNSADQSDVPGTHALHPAGLENPVANPQAVVVLGHARFTVLKPRLIRMEWAADGKFENHASFVFLNRNLTVPPFTQKVVRTNAGQVLTLNTDALHLRYTLQSGSDGKFTADDLEISFAMRGKKIVWHPGMPDTGNLLGTARTLDGSRGSHLQSPIGAGLISRNGWVVVNDSTRPLFNSANFTFSQGENSVWPWVMERPPGDRQDLYFFGYGHHYKQALGDFVQVAGPIPMPPYFAFGNWWSRYWAYTDAELDNLVTGFHDNDVPLNVLVIDMDWHQSFNLRWWKPRKDQAGQTLGWTGLSWNHLLFPDPTAFLHHIHRQDLQVTLNLHPASGVQPWETRYPEMARAMGIDPATKKYVPFDITNQKFATNYFDIMLHPLERQGVDFWWLDWQQQNYTALPGVNPTWWLSYVFFTDQAREGKRPIMLNRWGGLGNHRYQIGFSGDTISDWSSLAFQPWFTATAANVGFAYWSHDIGGHIPGSVDGELYTRWIQFGTFSPIMRTHTTRNPDAERRIWAYPEPYSDTMRSAYQLRYALMPYIYTEARRTYDTGVAFLRPLYYDWPNADQAYTSKNEYNFGGEMLVDPVVTPVNANSQLASETVWLPKGKWIEWETGKHFTGPITMNRKFSIRQIPVYVPEGAIVPMAPPRLHTAARPVEPLILTVFPQAPGSSSEYKLYQDARNTPAYRQGQAEWTTIHASQTGGDLTVRIDAAQGSYPGMPQARGYEIRLPGDWPPDSVTANGETLAYSARKDASGWRYQGNTLTTIITVPSHRVTELVEIQIHRSMQSIRRRDELDGFAGSMTRLREACDTLNKTFPIAWSPDSLIDVMQTGDRLNYHPETISQELTRYHAELPKAIEDVQKMKNAITPEDKQKIVKTLGADWQHSITAHMADYQSMVNRALVQVQDIAPAPAGRGDAAR